MKIRMQEDQKREKKITENYGNRLPNVKGQNTDNEDHTI